MYVFLYIINILQSMADGRHGGVMVLAQSHVVVARSIAIGHAAIHRLCTMGTTAQVLIRLPLPVIRKLVQVCTSSKIHVFI